jgi:hypothetical protein
MCKENFILKMSPGGTVDVSNTEKYLEAAMHIIQKPDSVLTHSDFQLYYIYCTNALENHIPLGIQVNLIIDSDRSGIADVKINARKQNWFRMALAHIGFFFIKLSRQKVEIRG